MKRLSKKNASSREQRQNSSRDAVKERYLLKILTEYFSQPQLYQADKWLTTYFKNQKNFGSHDRAWYSNQFYLALRLCSAVLYKRKFAFRDFTEFLPLLLDNLDTVFLREINEIKSSLPNIETDWADYGIPPWWNFSAQTVSLRPDSIKSFLQNSVLQPPLWLRVNDNTQVERIIKELSAEHFQVEKYQKEESISLQVQGIKGIFTFPFFREGLAEIQDYASQCIGIEAKVHKGMLVWDACAGGGGKTMQIASRLMNKGVVYASDIREYKLEDVKARAKKAKYFNVRLLPWNGRDLPEFPLEVRKKGGFHRVLVDAPCTASGTLRRNPDVRFRASHEQACQMQNLQLSILQKASETVLQGGKLIYATCSIFKKENEEVVEKFMAGNLAFHLESLKVHGSPEQNSDTMFTAVFSRI